MSLHRLLLVGGLLGTLIQLSLAVPENSQFALSILREHNDKRLENGLVKLRWSSKVAQYAQAWADKLVAEGGTLKHRTQTELTRKNYAENIFAGFDPDVTGETVTDYWYIEGEIAEDYGLSLEENAGHYLNIVQENARFLGCGLAKGTSKIPTICVCNYNPGR